MAEEKQLPKGVSKRLTWQTKRAVIETVTEQQLCRIDLSKRHLELIISYNYKSVQLDSADQKVEKDDIVRVHDFVPKAQLALQRTLYTHDMEEPAKDETLPPLNHAIILRYQGLSFWIYSDQKDADYLFKEIRAWLMEE